MGRVPVRGPLVSATAVGGGDRKVREVVEGYLSEVP